LFVCFVFVCLCVVCLRVCMFVCCRVGCVHSLLDWLAIRFKAFRCLGCFGSPACA
jgi:hypothetical protein